MSSAPRFTLITVFCFMTSTLISATEMRLRVMTYNIHSCKGRDGQIRPDRIADVIAEGKPDVVLLQEVRVGRVEKETATQADAQTAAVVMPPVGEPPLPPPLVVSPRFPSDSDLDVPFIDQPRRIATKLKMYYVFYPIVRMTHDDYGIAVLSRYQVSIVRAQNLPTLAQRRPLERRGAIWVELKVGDHLFQVVGTHLGLKGEEKNAQVEALLGPDFMGDSQMKSPFVMAGDFNSFSWQKPYQRLAKEFVDAPLKIDKARATFPTFFPLLRIDHVFVGSAAKVLNAFVIRSALSKQASDHLPLVVDVAW